MNVCKTCAKIEKIVLKTNMHIGPSVSHVSSFALQSLHAAAAVSMKMMPDGGLPWRLLTVHRMQDRLTPWLTDITKQQQILYTNNAHTWVQNNGR